MKLLERLRTQPAWQSDDPAVRVAAVRNLPADDRDLLLEIARGDPDPAVRRAAVERMPDLATLVAFLHDSGDAGDAEDDGRAEAAAAVRDTVVEATNEAGAVAALDALVDERDLAAVARAAGLEPVARAALERLATDKLLGAVARRAGRVEIALDAVRRLTDRDELLAVAVKADDKAPALAACERLVDGAGRDDAVLEAMSRQARHKGVARRARAALASLSGDRAVEAASRPGGDLCEGLEKRAATVTSLEEGRRALDDAVQRWAAVEEPIEPAMAERFAAARRAMEDRLLALDAAAVEAHRAAAERSAAESARVALCERVEALRGSSMLEELGRARGEWAALQDGDPDAGDAAGAALDVLASRFEAAAAACEARHAALVRHAERRQALEALTVELEQLAAGDESAERRKRWRVLEAAWRRELAALSEEGATPDAAAAEALAALQARKAAVDERQRAIEVDAKAERVKERQNNLARVGKLAGGVEAAIADEKLTLQEAERQLRIARQALDKSLPLPTRRDHDQMTRRLKDGVGTLLGKVRELRDFADWQRWANLGVQEELCREMEALASPPEGAPETTDADVARAFTDLMKRWRQAADVPQDRGQAIWERFKKAHDLIYPRCEPFFEAQRKERDKSLARRVELVEEAERLSESTDWLRTARRLTALQAEWKTLGPSPRREHQTLWKRLHQACSAFFTRRKADLAGRKQEWAANHEKKEALCVRVEALLEAEDLKAAIEEVKQVQREWKAVGPVRRNRSDAIWQRFRQACDGVFDRLNEGARQAAAERIAVREALCAELEALLPRPASDGSANGSAAQTKPAAEVRAETGEAAVEAAGETAGGDREATVAAGPEQAAADTTEAVGGVDGGAVEQTGVDPEAALGASAGPSVPEDPVKTVRDVQEKWRRAPEVPPEVKRKLAVRFSRALSRVVEAHADRFQGTEHDPAQRLKQFERLCKRAEALAGAGSRSDAGISPAELLARKWRAQMAANTMGVRVDEEAKRRAAREDVKRLQAERRRLGTLTGSEADALQARFQRACDRVFREKPA